jgi:hypothetical protein
VNSIRSGLLRLVDDASYREALVLRGFENARRFSVAIVANAYAELYRRVAAERISLRTA